MTQTPYGVMLTTSWGGHLGWFELGGARWFVKPVCTLQPPFSITQKVSADFMLTLSSQVTSFLNKMASEIDTNIPGVVEHPEKLPGNIVKHDAPNKDADVAPKPEFSAMRRKLALPLGI